MLIRQYRDTLMSELKAYIQDLTYTLDHYNGTLP